jgi:hypothetical protein
LRLKTCARRHRTLQKPIMGSPFFRISQFCEAFPPKTVKPNLS